MTKYDIKKNQQSEQARIQREQNEDCEFIEMRNRKHENKEVSYVEKRTFVMVLPDKREYFKEIKGDTAFTINGLAEEAVNALQLKSKTHNTAEVLVYSLMIKDGMMIRGLIEACSVKVPVVPMSFEEYKHEMDKAFASIPNEFHCLAVLALEELHVGYEDEVRFLNEFCEELKNAIKNYNL